MSVVVTIVALCNVVLWCIPFYPGMPFRIDEKTEFDAVVCSVGVFCENDDRTVGRRRSIASWFSS